MDSPFKSRKLPWTPKRKAQLAGASLVVLLIGAWLWKNLLPAIFPELFMHSAAPAPAPPPPPPAPTPSTTKPTTPTEGTSDEATAKQSLDDARQAFPKETIEKDPVAALLAFARVAFDGSGTASGKEAAKIADEIRKKYPEKLDAANKTAQDELAAFVAKEGAPLADFEHPTAIAELSNLQAKWTGLPATEAIAKERERVQALWDAVPAGEKMARQKFRALLKDPQTRDLKLDTAVAANDIATVYSQAVYGKRAADRRDELANPIADEIELAAGRAPKVAIRLALDFPMQLKNTPAGIRVAKARDRAKAQLPPEGGN